MCIINSSCWFCPLFVLLFQFGILVLIQFFLGILLLNISSIKNCRKNIIIRRIEVPNRIKTTYIRLLMEKTIDNKYLSRLRYQLTHLKIGTEYIHQEFNLFTIPPTLLQTTQKSQYFQYQFQAIHSQIYQSSDWNHKWPYTKSGKHTNYRNRAISGRISKDRFK